jgi:hypothetical protein
MPGNTVRSDSAVAIAAALIMLLVDLCKGALAGQRVQEGAQALAHRHPHPPE